MVKNIKLRVINNKSGFDFASLKFPNHSTLIWKIPFGLIGNVRTKTIWKSCGGLLNVFKSFQSRVWKTGHRHMWKLQCCKRVQQIQLFYTSLLLKHSVTEHIEANSSRRWARSHRESTYLEQNRINAVNKLRYGRQMGRWYLRGFYLKGTLSTTPPP